VRRPTPGPGAGARDAHPENNEPREPTVGERLLDQLSASEPTPADLAEYALDEKGLDERIASDPLTTIATGQMMLAARWLAAHGEPLMSAAGPFLPTQWSDFARPVFRRYKD
jgi:hypothetical protein